MIKLTFLSLLLLVSSKSWSQNLPFTLNLYQKDIPYQMDTDIEEERRQTEILVVSKVQQPQIEVYLPSKKNATGKAVVIYPGGGYGVLAYDWEGSDIAKWLNSHGIAGVVVKYRLPSSATQTSPHLVPMTDGKRAIRLVRAHATEWNINPDQIGIMGFSAGGHLASTLGTHFDAGDSSAEDEIEKISSRPDFMILGYPVISFSQHITHIESRNNLIGKEPAQKWIDFFSNELQVKSDTPPTFIFHAQDDKAVPVQHSLLFYGGLLEKEVPVEMHLFPIGGHGFSLSLNQEGTQQGWMENCIRWIKHLP